MNVNIEKAKHLAGRPFRLAEVSLLDGVPNFREEFQTGFEYWTRYRADIMNKRITHRVGYWEDGQFYSKGKFSTGGWEPTQWSDYEYEENGKTFNYFKKKMLGLIEFQEPQDLPDVWNSEEKQKGVEGVTEAYVTISPSLYEKICKEYEDPRTTVDDYLEIVHEPNNPPATMYEVRFSAPGEPRTGDANTTEDTDTSSPSVTPGFSVFPQEADILKEVEGDEADEATLVEYMVAEATNRGMEGFDESRAHEIASNVIVDGKVILP